MQRHLASLASSFLNQQIQFTSRRTMVNALVLGVYNKVDEGEQVFTKSATKFDQDVGGKLRDLVVKYGPSKKNKVKVFHGVHPEFPLLGVVGLGPPDAGFNESEDIDERRENIRAAMAIGAKAVRDDKVETIFFDACGDAEASAEGANLVLWSYDELKSEKYKKKKPKVQCYQPDNETQLAFNCGQTLAQAQNTCRRLAEMPSNLMTPTIFCQTIIELFKPFPQVEVKVHDKEWAESKKMGAFLGVAKGSAEPPKFLEVHYNNKKDSKPFVLVGKGICFDSGGISIKPAANMDKMRYDMSGAAHVMTTTYALAALQSKVNVIALAPLCENMVSGSAYKPGDVVTAMNGKTIQVDNTDAEGRLILADGLCYAHEFDPQAILDIATLTGAVKVALGPACCGVFTNNSELFKTIHKAASHTGDRVWRMPLYSYYKSQVTDSQLADCLNVGKGAGGGSCTAAAFLSEFVNCPKWIHLDIAGIMQSNDEYPYIGKGMSGRPMRTLFYFLNKYFDQ